MKFELELRKRNIPNDDLIQDVKEVAKKIGRNTVTMAEYECFGKYHTSTLQRRLRSWFNVLDKAGMQASRSSLNITEEDLFENIKDIWISLGRQPKYDEIKKPISRYSVKTYENRFGSWYKSLEAFIEYINAAEQDNEAPPEIQVQNNNTSEKQLTRKTKREISERLRFSILLRDGFKCKTCGRSPLNSHGVELHVDHIIPWSRGGETVADNLQTKCKECNLGKGNAFDK